MKVYHSTDIGKVRRVNQDAYYVPGKNQNFIAVADGMGGHNAGEIASAMAIREFSSWLDGIDEPNEKRLREAFTRANREIFRESQRDDAKRGMGTTMTALWFSRREVYLAHVGDTRAYLFRNGALMQLSTDHTLVEEMVKSGLITPEKAAHHPQRNIIMRSLGPRVAVEVDVLKIDNRLGDVWLLCSDGLTKYVSDLEIAETLHADATWEDKTSRMMNLALDRGGSDNITLLIAVEEGNGYE